MEAHYFGFHTGILKDQYNLKFSSTNSLITEKITFSSKIFRDEITDYIELIKKIIKDNTQK